MKYIKYIPWILIIILLIGLSIYQYRHTKDLEAIVTAKNEKLMAANLDLGRAHTRIANADALINKLNKQVKAEIKKRQATINLYAELEALYKAEKKKVKTITKIIYKDKVIDLPKGKVFLRSDDGTYEEVTSMTWSYKDFRIHIHGDAIQQTLSYRLHQKFRAQFIESKLPNGGFNHYASLYEMDDKGNNVAKLKLDKFEVIRSRDLPNKFMWWNPKLDGMVGAGTNNKLDFTWVGEIGVSLSAYGKTTDDISLRFIRFGTGITNYGFSLTFSPVQINIAQWLPLVSNLWLTPYGGWDFYTEKPHFGAGISVVF